MHSIITRKKKKKNKQIDSTVTNYPIASRARASCSSSELAALEGLAELPASGDGAVAGDGAAVAGGDLERERLPVQVRVALPVLAPVPGHGLPPRAGAPDGDGAHVAGARHVGHQHQVEVGVPVDGEPDAALLHARHSPERDGHDAGAVLRDAEEGRLGHVEVRARRVAPAAVVAGEAVVGRAEVGGRDGDGARQAPPPVVVAPQLVAGPARRAVVEQRRAQRRRARAVPRAVQVAVPAGAAHCAGRVPAAVERGVRALPPAGSGLPREESEQEEKSAGNGHR
uniref:Uncharacterized protein n=1 Tax=Zea mays TaxID=4577 RepID=B8A0Z6_MAIZE|nr:unknown [Zea mays]